MCIVEYSCTPVHKPYNLHACFWLLGISFEGIWSLSGLRTVMYNCTVNFKNSRLAIIGPVHMYCGIQLYTCT